MCLFPWGARRCPDGGRPIPDREGELKLPCGKCHECLKLRSVEWGIRARHEISLHKDNCFITLSYSDENLESEFVIKKPFQDFLKKLRKYTGKKLSYMVSHEYGSKTKRPHHHAIIFGWSPKKWEYLKDTGKGNKIYTSPELSKLWTKGYHSIGEANGKTAYYIASYALKGKHHQVQTQEGELVEVTDSFDCSKRPGIGYRYLKLHFRQLVDSGETLPRSYVKKLEHYGDPEHNHYIGHEYMDALQDYQDKAKISARGSQERLAKLCIANAKLNIDETNFRTAPDGEIHLKLKQYLKNEVQHLTGENT